MTVFPDDAPLDWSVWHEVFERHGAPGTVETDDPPSLGAYFAPGDERLVPSLVADLQAFGPCRIESTWVEEQDWSEAWKQFFRPKEIGPFLVRPTWEEPIEPSSLTEIVLDPGQAFGTGDHPTTQMCLELLAGLDLAGKSVADIGCGSGVLSIASARRGAARIDAVDLDLPAVEATRANSELNAVEVQAFLGRGFEPLPPGTYDVVLSNIISAALIALAPEVASRLVPKGRWLVSGIIRENWPDVLAAAEKSGFSLVERKEGGDWVAAVLSR
ncbi:MAG: 50S ribosomal protein L11 methyltransferase [Fimbriimonadaceae bacterium]|nr:50S ribosomal protein L11 methyltransferase [Fimbriimonadaceae bacterium]QYK59220.1 MAG: 50S ribosomal protein L11 methyltransferase [Fimbriimonadaceae bacterium]